LRALWPLLRPGGVMLYSTCSFLREENDEVVEEIVRSGAQTIVPTETWGRATRFGLQVLPGEHSLDGFYYARLKMPADIQVAQRQ
ncbi:MAG: 16S rRNA (cytosine(967)-C(5))-methyltransferase, partial [Gammaproteobacteria bacterium]